MSVQHYRGRVLIYWQTWSYSSWWVSADASKSSHWCSWRSPPRYDSRDRAAEDFLGRYRSRQLCAPPRRSYHPNPYELLCMGLWLAGRESLRAIWDIQEYGHWSGAVSGHSQNTECPLLLGGSRVGDEHCRTVEAVTHFPAHREPISKTRWKGCWDGPWSAGMNLLINQYPSPTFLHSSGWRKPSRRTR